MTDFTADGAGSIAVTATATGAGSLGISGVGDGSGVRGQGKTWHGVVGLSEGGFGVYGEAKGSGVVGKSTGWHGVGGFTDNPEAFGVYGESKGAGVVGKSTGWHGVGGFSGSTTGGVAVYGEHTQNGVAVKGVSQGGMAVVGISQQHEGVHAETHSPGTAAIAAYNLNPSGTGAAVFAKKEGTQGHAGFFDGNVWIGRDAGVGGTLTVTKDVILAGADCAEEFDVLPQVDAEPGTVMVIVKDGSLAPCAREYDARVAGVVSGAGHFRPALILDRRPQSDGRHPIALFGKVYCKVDASVAPIEPGDMLTTSALAGHAMKAADRSRAVGSILGKALGACASGQALIPILVALN